MDIVARGVLTGGAPGGPVVAVEGEENLVVPGYQLVPQMLSVVGEFGLVAVRVRVHQLVGGEDDRRVRVLGDDVLRPGEPGRRRPPVERQYQPFTAGGAEQVVRVVAVRGRPAERRQAPHPLRAEGVQVRRAAALVVGGRLDVMVARDDAVADPPPVEQPERLSDRREFACPAALGEVAQMGQEDDVLVAPVIEYVTQRRLDGRLVDARPVEEVLGVRHDDEREPRVLGVGPPTGRDGTGVLLGKSRGGRG